LDEGREGFEERESVAAEANSHALALCVDVIGGKRADADQRLGVEHDEGADDAVGDVKRGVVDELAGDPPALFGIGAPGSGRGTTAAR